MTLILPACFTEKGRNKQSEFSVPNLLSCGALWCSNPTVLSTLVKCFEFSAGAAFELNSPEREAHPQERSRVLYK